MLRGIEEKHPEAERAGEFGKFLLLIGRKRVNQNASALRGESWVPKERRAICMLESRPNAPMKSEELQPAPVKVPTVDRILGLSGVPA
jgi:hypothetical protein